MRGISIVSKFGIPHGEAGDQDVGFPVEGSRMSVFVFPLPEKSNIFVRGPAFSSNE